jgi:hypothetical protein
MSKNVFISPGVYTSEKDLTFVTRQIGVTTLGLVGETTIGPAFQPIFISNYGEFQSFFGGLNPTKVKDTGAPLYELPYIAKSYLSQSNQLFVTRVLGFSGYDAGLAWGITMDSELDTSTTGSTNNGVSYPTLISFSATSAGTITNLVSNDSLIQSLINNGTLTPSLSYLGGVATGTTTSFNASFLKVGSSFTGVSFNLYVNNTNFGSNGSSIITGLTSGSTTYYSGSTFADVENQLVALLRSRGTINNSTQLPSFELTGTTNVIFNPSYTASTNNSLGLFSLSGKSTLQGNFNYNVSMDKTQKNYITKVLGRNVSDGNTALYVEELYGNLFNNLNASGKVRGLKQTLINYNRSFSNYQQEYQPAVTPYVVSELRGNKVLKLFRLWTISDGNAANEQFKISIINIKPDDKEFDVIIRSFYDTDASPVVLESYTRCNMNPTSANYIGRKIGTMDGSYVSKSSYVLVDIDDTSDTSDAFPSGFIGYPIRNYQSNSNSGVLNPKISYKKTYSTIENKRKVYLGISDTVGIDSDIFDYKGLPLTTTNTTQWTGLTSGFHLDIDASGVTIDNVTLQLDSSGNTYSPIYKFDTGNAQFRTDSGLVGTDYEKLYSRKFSLVPYGGFDGWDVYNTRRTNTDNYILNGQYGKAGLTSGAFSNRTLTNGEIGLTSDYYAYLEAIWTFRNPQAVNINIFATPGIDTFDNTNLVESTIEMIEQERADSLYIVTTPDYVNGAVLSSQETVDNISGMFDSNYTCTYWPWVQVNDTENNVLVFIPPTRDVVRNIALTDNIAFPWFASAGIQRGDIDAIQARKKLTQSDQDELYGNRINPIVTFTTDGIKIWGNKTLQVKDTALNRINVRRLLLQARKLISAVSIRLLFDQDDSIVRNQFLSLVNPILDNIRKERGLIDFRVVLSDNPEDYDRNQLSAQIFLKPTRSLEYIKIDFIITNTGASFNDI